MKIAPFALASAFAIIGFATAGYAQSSDRDDRRSEHRWDRGDQDDSRSRQDGDSRRESSDDRESRRGGDEGRRGHHRGPHYGGMPHYNMGQMAGGRGPMERGARFRITNGDVRIDIQCPAQIEIQNCVQAAGQLFDHIGKRADGAGPDQGTSGSGPSLETPPDTGAPSKRM